MTLGYQDDQPTRADIDAMPGQVALEFGSNQCTMCRAARPALAAAIADRPHVRHIMAADGHGVPLGRSFGIKLWPTLVLLRDGVEVARVVRPASRSDVDAAFTEVGFDSP
jgi:thioredoxin 1